MNYPAHIQNQQSYYSARLGRLIKLEINSLSIKRQG